VGVIVCGANIDIATFSEQVAAGEIGDGQSAKTAV
jgi:hypothetical protein